MASSSESISPGLKRLFKVLGVLVAVSAAINFYAFVLKEDEERPDSTKQYAEQIAKDPLFSDVTYEGAKGNPESNESVSSGSSAEGGTAVTVSLKSESDDESVSLKGIPLLKGPISAEGVTGEITAENLGGRLNRIEFSFTTAQPPALTEEELVAGVRRVWIRSVDAFLYPPNGATIQEQLAPSPENGPVTMTGKAKAYIEYNGDNNRTVFDVALRCNEVSDRGIKGVLTVSRNADAPLEDGSMFAVAEEGGKSFKAFLTADFSLGANSES